MTKRRMFVPSIGDEFTLAEDWTFPLFMERRNATLAARARPGLTYRDDWRHREMPSFPCTLPAGTVLKVSRVYIRQGGRAFDSLTFLISSAPGDENRKVVPKQSGSFGYADKTYIPLDNGERYKLQGARFWAKLESVNEIVFEE